MTHTAEELRALADHAHNAGCLTTRQALRYAATLAERQEKALKSMNRGPCCCRPDGPCDCVLDAVAAILRGEQ